MKTIRLDTADACKGAASAICALWISVPFAIKLLFFLCAVDLITCLFNKRRSVVTAAKKCALSLILTITVQCVYEAAKSTTGINVGFDVGTGVAVFYSLATAIAILQNMSEAGLELPPQLLALMKRADGLTDREKQAIDDLSGKPERHKTAKSGE